MSKLFSPLTLNLSEKQQTTVRNRLIMPPMCMYSADSEGPRVGLPNPFHLEHYGVRATSVGQVVVEATGIRPDGRISPQCLCVSEDTRPEDFAPLATAIKEKGALAGIQLNHAGPKASELVASPRISPDSLSTSEISELVATWGHAAKLMAEAGFDFVQVHSAHGYLLHSFLSPYTNHRTDEYGGMLENRARFVLQVLAEVGRYLPVAVRFSGTDWLGEDGLEIAEVEYVAQWAQALGVHQISMSTGGIAPDASAIPVGPGYQVFAARQVRAAMDSMILPVHDLITDEVLEQRWNQTSEDDESAWRDYCAKVSAVGIILNGVQAESILATGAADLIEVGRPLLANPYLGFKWQAELGEEVELPRQYRRAVIV
ncbi:hypothetical protein BK816_08765 [Boudabousia tangfeifanii]|uniref:NADH:flavin oxidoreductase/NADH oxidase N-terminal domain-containing protein n=1 Tax=Boudabousia tangfeifanii TaxID=1912795 RepID=A0A1D9MMD2_9ACTO|nr:hypothetical protein [Boudabousia tangfeifanii]AOZ73349.1 hypothetical protein BK816_08765 [Boudabousia tangfeifanii]